MRAMKYRIIVAAAITAVLVAVLWIDQQPEPEQNVGVEELARELQPASQDQAVTEDAVVVKPVS